jgi:hypothetical protein
MAFKKLCPKISHLKNHFLALNLPTTINWRNPERINNTCEKDKSDFYCGLSGNDSFYKGGMSALFVS